MLSKIVSSLADESRRYWPSGFTPADNKPPDIEMIEISHTTCCLHSYGTGLPPFMSQIAYLKLILESSGIICCIRALRRMVAITR